MQNYATYPSMPGALRAVVCPECGVTLGIRTELFYFFQFYVALDRENHGVVALFGAARVCRFAAVFRLVAKMSRPYPRYFRPELTSGLRPIRRYPICVGWSVTLDVLGA